MRDAFYLRSVVMHTEDFEIDIHNSSELFGSDAALAGDVVEDFEL